MLVLAVACRDQGGELRDATARRRAEMASRGTASAAPAAAPADTSTRLPAFLSDTPTRAPLAPPAAPADTAARDTSAQAAADAWTTGVRQGGHVGTLVTARGLRTNSDPRDGYDRLVLDFGAQPLPRWRVSYADAPPSRCGSGQATAVPGQAWLVVHLHGAQAHDDAGAATLRQRSLPLNMPVMTQMEVTCDLEGELEVVVGVSSANPYRVLELQNPSRLAIDVRQQP